MQERGSDPTGSDPATYRSRHGCGGEDGEPALRAGDNRARGKPVLSKGVPKVSGRCPKEGVRKVSGRCPGKVSRIPDENGT